MSKNKEMRFCLECNKDISKENKLKQFCNTKCNTKYRRRYRKENGLCAGCGEIPDNPKFETCTKCRELRHVEKSTIECAICGEDFKTNISKAKACEGICTETYKKEQKAIHVANWYKRSGVKKRNCKEAGCKKYAIKGKQRCDKHIIEHKEKMRVARLVKQEVLFCVECGDELDHPKKKYCDTECSTKNFNAKKREKRQQEKAKEKPKPKKEKPVEKQKKTKTEKQKPEKIKTIKAKEAEKHDTIKVIKKADNKPRFKTCKCGMLFKGKAEEEKCMPCRMKLNKKEVHHDS